jgi:DNA repair protein RadC
MNDTGNTPKHFRCSADVYAEFHERLRHQSHEWFYALCLDERKMLLEELELAVGDDGEIAVPLRRVFKQIVATDALHVIFVHNHPDGNVMPTDNDRSTTEKLMAGLAVLGIWVLDHVIIGSDRYASMADRGELHGDLSPPRVSMSPDGEVQEGGD